MSISCNSTVRLLAPCSPASLSSPGRAAPCADTVAPEGWGEGPLSHPGTARASHPMPVMRSVHHTSDLLSPDLARENQHPLPRLLPAESCVCRGSASRYAEAYYSQIRLDLGLTHVVQRDQVPWLWDKRCQIYLYPTARPTDRRRAHQPGPAVLSTTRGAWSTATWRCPPSWSRPCRMS